MAARVLGTVGNDRLLGSDVASESYEDRIIGYAGNDTLYGGLGHDKLYGGDGNNVLYGGDGNDRIFVNSDIKGSDKIYGGNGNDFIKSMVHQSYVEGGAGDDVITTSAADDVIYGGAGRDKITGNAGHDKMFGGEKDNAADLFVFASTADSSVKNRDVVYDFVSGQDDIKLNSIDANTTLKGNQDFQFNGTTAKAGAIWYKDTGANVVVYGDVNRDSIADFAIEIANINSLKATDFIL